MVEGDTGWMTLMERITDAPCKPRAYLDYLRNHYRGLCEHWESLPDVPSTDGYPTAKECVVLHLSSFIGSLEDLAMKFDREAGHPLQKESASSLSSERSPRPAL